MAGNNSLHEAKVQKNDEFYTRLVDIENELGHYTEHFKDKVVLCNCDDPQYSNFCKYFALNFNYLGLKKLITTHYEKGKQSYKLEYARVDDPSGQLSLPEAVQTPLQGDGDFRSEECIEILKEADIVVTNPPFSCFSCDTEVMTSSGWKFIKDVDISKDLIMSVEPETKAIEMVKAVDKLESPVRGELYHFHSRHMDFCVTGNHKMYSYHKRYDGTYRMKPLTDASDVKKTDLLPVSGFSWKGKNVPYFILPATTQTEQYTRKEIIVNEKKIPMEDWLEFFGFWLADGCCRDHINVLGKRDYTVSIKQNEANEKYVLDLIKRIGFNARIEKQKTGNNNYCIYSKQLWKYLIQFGRSRDKFIPREFLDLDTKYLRALYKGYTMGDGSLCTSGSMYFSSVSRHLIDNVQELILKLFGRITRVRKYKKKHSYDDNYGICYSIVADLESNTYNYSKYGTPEKVPYNDKVYCLTLEKNHVMLVRHNGVIGWCGNCFREYISQLMLYEKKFLIIGNKNAITYKDVFPLIKDNKIWLGYTSPTDFMTPNGLTHKVNGLARWFTNLDIKKRHEPLFLTKKYYGHEDEYPKYDNYDAINVDKVKDIPCDYFEDMGVPITFLDKHCPEQFEIVKFRKGDDEKDLTYNIKECDALTDRQTDRQTETDHTLLQDRHQTKDVTESWEFRSPSSTSSAQSSSKSSIQLNAQSEQQLKNSLHQELMDGTSTKNENTQGSSLEEKCSGIMGVPITFLDKYCPEQFEIVGFAGGWNGKSQLILKNYNGTQLQHNKDLSVQEVSKLNDGTPLIKISSPNKLKTTFYENRGDFYIRTYGRILIKQKGEKINENNMQNNK